MFPYVYIGFNVSSINLLLCRHKYYTQFSASKLASSSHFKKIL